MKDKLIATKDEDALLAELDKYANHLLSFGQRKDILVTQKQANTLRRLAATGDGFVDRRGLIGYLGPAGETYRGFRIATMVEARRRTKRDLLPLIT